MSAGPPGTGSGPPHGGSGGGQHYEPPPEEHEEHEHEEGEAWLISYADLMTLLFGLFALMFSFAKFDDSEATVKVDKALVKYFGQNTIDPVEEHDKKKKADPKDVNNGDNRGRDVGNYSGLGNQVKAEIDKLQTAKEASIKQAPDGFEINFVSSLLFDSARADLKPGALDLVGKLAMVIKNTGLPYQVRVEGHTDDNPMHSGVFPSNWELSAARAASLLRIFERSGFEPWRLMAIGYGSSRPAYPNRTPAGKVIADNQMLNRRVIIKVLLPEVEAAPPPGVSGSKKPAGSEPAVHDGGLNNVGEALKAQARKSETVLSAEPGGKPLEPSKSNTEKPAEGANEKAPGAGAAKH